MMCFPYISMMPSSARVADEVQSIIMAYTGVRVVQSTNYLLNVWPSVAKKRLLAEKRAPRPAGGKQEPQKASTFASI